MLPDGNIRAFNWLYSRKYYRTGIFIVDASLQTLRYSRSGTIKNLQENKERICWLGSREPSHLHRHHFMTLSKTAHSLDLTAETLYEAVAQALAVLRYAEWTERPSWPERRKGYALQMADG
jgi:hypothetical protein